MCLQPLLLGSIVILFKGRGKNTMYRGESSQDIGETFLYLFGDPPGGFCGASDLAQGKPCFPHLLPLFAIVLASFIMVRELKRTMVLDISGLLTTLSRFEISKAVDDLYCEDFVEK